ncbi:Galactose/methyl galactoside import ATP-binding protein MglA [Listeria fleischmannii subsp. fleischmannii]|uniref:Galactose/methyl galactoside import ATP-binding protein MglA n=1 Tax=Listeria fleischmannii subsp. fleischmannii TaxID=1671902 RepID=A0A2X3H9X8_9LIST|nr:Galactose/methyl galactoside import ATP-binding protein MglA [Listeria fleischmannii subsp. fleischmannii]
MREWLFFRFEEPDKGSENVDYVIEMLGIRKEFSGFVANDNITLQLKQGEIHALLGENGAGKSTLMNVLFGLYEPDGGEIRVRGQKKIFTVQTKQTTLESGWFINILC